MASMDFYRRVPKDLTEATSLGAMMSIAAIAVMTILFLSETIAFARTSMGTAITLDENDQPQIRLNFNITLMDLHCDFVSVDVWDTLGTNRQNVTKNIEKWQLDEEGQRRIFSGRNREQREVVHEEHEETLEELHEDGEQAVELTPDTFQGFVNGHEMAFIDMYAPWCIWCQRLHPTWEKFGEEVHKLRMPVGVGKVNCVTYPQLCKDQKVMAFPTLRWYKGGQMILPDYKMDRTVDALVGYTKRKLEMEEKYKNWAENNPSDSRMKPNAGNSRPEHPGCQVSGHLMVNRVPGNFHIEAKSVNHNLNAAMTNLTHRVNHLSFGEPITKLAPHLEKTPFMRKVKRILKQVPEEHKQFNPMDDKEYITAKFHQAYHHYIKVVSTQLNMGSSRGAETFNDVNSISVYQMLEQSQIVFYDEVNVPEARFSYDMSPMSVVVQKEGRKWYDYLTSLCAIIGGTFTTLGLIDATLYKIFKPKKL
eukprot:CAMPEP_0201713282 /NCGR_PEP_ID=MMETSP0593-20130828/180_1 /ASSEMBLY_ACC=CAM_ASM_000672 /TAXON_ID=267983 /ORGANISM="Skeletonema japonicum, Strain CCMP2506" /LENGTH=476 /DNA_ID=CAMNT_0048202405 /DNA_START=117 /DNA_END=1547 /DNA_ORIENTATION=-